MQATQLTIAQIKQRMKNWGATTTCRKVTTDPVRWQCDATVTIYGTTYRGYGSGETMKEARSVAMYELARNAF